MKVAYVDSSCLVALRFGEPGARELSQRLAGVSLHSSNLLEAEYASALAREGAEDVDDLLGHVTWIFPDRPLTAEIVRVLRAGYVRGCDLWHLANALYLTEQPAELAFVTLDRRQQAVASALGFPTV